MVAGDDGTNLTRPRLGRLVGRFDPPRAEDAFAVAFALQACERLDLRIEAGPEDSLPAGARAQALRHLFPEARIALAGDPADAAQRPDAVFGLVDASDLSRAEAARLGARFVPVAPPGNLAACARPATAEDPTAPWFPPHPPAPPRRLPRVCLFGPESTGKSTLGLALARRYGTVMAPEYGRLYTETFGQDCGPEDLRRMALGHLAGVAAASGWAARLLIEDTDPVLTAIWSDVLTGARDPWFDAFDATADLYLLTGIDAPFVADGIRYFPGEDARRDFHRRCRDELVRRSLPFVEVTGDEAARLAAAVRAIDAAGLSEARKSS